MYLSHFGLNQSPFAITPNPDFFYAGNQRGAILEALLYAVTHGEGIVKVTGEVGSGKTMLCRMLESMLPQNVEVIYLVNPSLSREQVVYAIAGELGLDTGGKRPDEVIRLLQADLIGKYSAGMQVLLLVEEAQAMPLDTLEEIRLFSNLETAHHKLLQIVLFGQPELDDSLNLPRMRQLKERITHSFSVPPLEPTVLAEFLMFRMRAAGYHGPDLFTKGALRQIAAVSEGIVRRVSILADKALLAAFADNTHAITARHVEAAVRDSEFSGSPLRRRHALKRAALGTLLFLCLLLGAQLAWMAWQGPASAPPASGAPAAAPAVAPAVTPAAAAARAAHQVQASPAWLAAQQPGHFTLQLAVAEADPARLHALLLKLDDEVGLDQVHVFPTRVGGEARSGVLYAVFATREAALAAKNQLAAEWGYQARLRKIAGLHAEMASAK